MIYIPIKDLIFRYSILYVIAKYSDNKFIKNCFSNRLEHDESKKYFLQSFSEISHPSWCRWQKSECETESVLLRTDISSFYDSVAHDYLLDAVSKELDIPRDCKFINTLNIVLKVPLQSYSTKTKRLNNRTILRQGLAIGNNCDAFLANLYLKDSDDLMTSVKNIKYGRYVDDIRIFAKDRRVALNAVKILQENLLTKGLNLNGSKTELAEDNKSKIKIVSRETPYDDEDLESTNEKVIKNKIDKSFYEFEETFPPIPNFLNNFEEKDSKAKDYCKFLSTKNNKLKFVQLKERTIDHIFTIAEIIKKWQGASKHASLLLVESAFYNKVLRNTRNEARKKILELIKSKEVSSYGKYRIIHHLIKIRKNKKKNSFFDQLNITEKNILYSQIDDYLKTPSLELNVIALILLNKKINNIKSVEVYIEKFYSLNLNQKKIPGFLFDSLEYLKCKIS